MNNVSTDKALSENIPLSVSFVSLGLLKPNPFNPRFHSRRQIKQLARSIKTFGFLVPILVNKDGLIIAGHGRFEAAKLLSLECVPVIYIDHLSQDQVKAFTITDNCLTDNSVWDNRLLAEQLQQLSTLNLDFDLDVIGLTFDQIHLRIDSLSSQNEDANSVDQVPAISEGQAISRESDLWQLGRHRLLCGDTTKSTDVERVMGGKQAVMTVTDPPYNVDYGNSTKTSTRDARRPILNDNLGDGFEAFLLVVCINILAITSGAVYICMSSSALHILQGAFVKAGGHWSTFIIWAKQAFTLGRSDYQRQYEPILYGWRKGTERYWCGARDQGDVWLFDKPVKSDLHPTMKPVELIMRAIRNSSERDDIVFDGFLGSGSTLIAAERTGRICHGIELDPRYVDVCIRRWQQHTGEHAIHIGTGRRFDDIAAEAEVHHVG